MPIITTSQIAKSNNNLLNQRLLQSIKKLPNHVIELTCVHDDAFNWQINELSETQKSNFKKLINEI